MKNLLTELDLLGFERTLVGLNMPHSYIDCRSSELEAILVFSEDCSVVQVKKEKTGGFKVTPCRSITSYTVNSGPVLLADPPGVSYHFEDEQGVLDFICKATLNGSFLDEPDIDLSGGVVKYNLSTSYSWSTVTTINDRG